MIRAWARTAALALWCLAAVPLPLLAALLTIGRPAAKIRAATFLNRGFACGICTIFGVRVRVEGTPPPEGAFVAPNHWSWIDAFVLGSVYRGVFVSRADVADWRFFGYLARAGGTLFLDRATKRDASRVRDEIERLLRGRCRVTAFLEGGAGDGKSVRPFKSSLLDAAAATGAPCVPTLLVYSLPASPELDPSRVVAWTGDESMLAHAARLLRVPRIDAVVRFLPPRSGADRKELARALESDLRAALEARSR